MAAKVRSRVRIDDRGWKQFQRKMARLSKKRLSVGIVDDQSADGDFSMADLMAVHEFGSMDGHIPERKPIRHTAEKNRADYMKELETATDRVLTKKATAEGELKKLGERVRGDIVRAIQNDELGIPNAPSTIAQKGSSLPLVDTGALVGSIKAVVK